jgi:hypothetical protein
MTSAPDPDLPAGIGADDVGPGQPSFRARARLRRRARYLRRARELGLRDLGGLVFELHRFERRNDEAVQGKLAALEAVDRELRAVEHALDRRPEVVELHEPGLASCPRCGALHASDARFCSQCGLALADGEPGASEAAPTVPEGPEVA